VKIYIDGGTRGSKICLVDTFKNRTITKFRGGKPTNNELEYLALLYSLEYINNNYKNKNIEIYTDSLLIVNQINGKWRVTTDTLRPLYNKCSKKLTEKIKIKWIRRHLNLAGVYLEKDK
jgi:ribonuclease HI|tara:strand:+ start:6762 stop:7118 length:357 start_codon:yes stop_codon:yes gene_type:complete